MTMLTLVRGPVIDEKGGQISAKPLILNGLQHAGGIGVRVAAAGYGWW